MPVVASYAHASCVLLGASLLHSGSKAWFYYLVLYAFDVALGVVSFMDVVAMGFLLDAGTSSSK